MKHLFLIFSISFAWSITIKKDLYCPAIRECLGIQPKTCLKKTYPKVEDVEYTKEFCEPLKILQSRGVSPHSKTGQEMYTLMGQEYRVVYSVDGKLPITEQTMKYLMNNLPFTSLLVNAYKETNYSAHYTDKQHKHFQGSNGRSLRGVFQWEDRRDNQRQNLLYGAGFTKILMWNLKGDAMVTLDYKAIGTDSVSYSLSCYAFPGNTLINGIMQLGMFKNVVLDKITEIIKDVETAASEFAKGNRKPIQDYKKLQNSKNRFYLQQFEATLPAHQKTEVIP